MGRARGRIHAISDTGFAAVMGSRRGLGDADTLLAKAPTERAREELHRLVASPGFDETAEALSMLNRYSTLVAERPLLNQLADDLCTRAATESIGAWSSSTKSFLNIAGVRGRKSDQLFVDGRDELHVAADGRDYRVRSGVKTACGIDLGRSDIYRANRGAWNNLAAEKMQRCPDCEASASDAPDCRESRNYPALADTPREAVSASMSGRIRANLDTALAAGEGVDEDVLEETSYRAYPTALLDTATEQVYSGGPATLARALGEDRWRKLTAQVPASKLDPADIWDEDEWRGYLLPYLPTSSTPLPREDDMARTERARESLFVDLCADLGVKRVR